MAKKQPKEVNKPVQMPLWDDPQEAIQSTTVHGIRSVMLDGAQWWVAADVCRRLNLNNTAMAVLPVPSIHTRKGIVQSRGGPQTYRLLDRVGVSIVLQSTRRSVDPFLASTFRLRVVKSCIEAETTDFLARSLAAFSPALQFTCGPYRLDMYLRKANIAIECDERGHRNRKTDAEQARQKFIESALGCRFVRFNPHAAEFHIADVVGSILSMIVEDQGGRPLIGIMRRQITAS